MKTAAISSRLPSSLNLEGERVALKMANIVLKEAKSKKVPFCLLAKLRDMSRIDKLLSERQGGFRMNEVRIHGRRFADHFGNMLSSAYKRARARVEKRALQIVREKATSRIVDDAVKLLADTFDADIILNVTEEENFTLVGFFSKGNSKVEYIVGNGLPGSRTEAFSYDDPLKAKLAFEIIRKQGWKMASTG